MLRLGTYKHYKGKYYQVIGVALHSETQEQLVVYYCLYPNPKGQLWVRPLNKFQENVIVDGRAIPRFEYVEDVSEL
ncbi:MAG: hypothetical protein UX04_C0002G0265 [Microgenomates group bacterium GW2011_GWF2_45_18]|nr:MAG: hypothetical protein UW18_C0003G0297 [Microgenomates group bacterium GW2011_GWF1_44_10]KKU02122.1 MAG: hypothetical protein UX04_C0002G0265 [Microgenomates group bacterium GW2011_GWF2_45_18]OGJ41766.1 MAG: hypothetical protein A2378_00600 [Candidatus Pacebacteria bacterium RIFOXYB1_FULL_44_10]HAU98673.1 DUF1653 domain-containing protein [Candidatus Paceibacterota bacterium]HAX01901.1 DUF1653 domain-containing protein [Candidatus Paceibacterota bacterium]